MPEDTTPPANSGDNQQPQEDQTWQGRYAGLQKVLAKRDTELTTAAAELDRLRKESEQTLAELNTYRQRDVDNSEEELARQQFEALRARFEPEAPRPVGNNQQRPAKGWEDGSDSSWSGRDRLGTSSGFPT